MMEEAGSKRLLNFVQHNDSRSTQYKLYRCGQCHSHVKGYNSLIKHRATCTKHYCQVCKKLFHREDTYRKHLKNNCPPCRFSCSKCCKTYSRKSDCSAHEKQCLGMAKHKCGNCDIVFLTKKFLDDHQCSKGDIKDNGAEASKPVDSSRCAICDVVLSTKELLQDHQCVVNPVRAVFGNTSTQEEKLIKTVVFFDLETTGLIEGDKMPEIIEFSFVAVNRESFANVASNHIPRVVDKLRLTVKPVHPMKYTTTFITGNDKVTIFISNWANEPKWGQIEI